MARKHMMQRWTSSAGVTTREFHRGFLWQRQSHQFWSGCWRVVTRSRATCFISSLLTVGKLHEKTNESLNVPVVGLDALLAAPFQPALRPSQDWGRADRGEQHIDGVWSHDLFQHQTDSFQPGYFIHFANPPPTTSSLSTKNHRLSQLGLLTMVASHGWWLVVA